MNFENYLCQKNYSPQTIRSYLYAVNAFLSDCPEARKFSYKQVLEQLGAITISRVNKSSSIVLLSGLKKYYDFLLDTGQRTDHPCRNLYIKDNSPSEIIQLDLFSSAELQSMLNRTERYTALADRNILLVSLLIFQGITPGEIITIKTRHVDLTRNRIFISGTRKLNKRYLPIPARQAAFFKSYLSGSRPLLEKKPGENLLLGKRGNPVTVDDINYLVSTFKPLFPDRNLNAGTIRQSVIANWLNEYDLPLEQVQLMAGHKWISATEKYRFDPTDEQRRQINAWYPL